jgi:hypothetical protein
MRWRNKKPSAPGKIPLRQFPRSCWREPARVTRFRTWLFCYFAAACAERLVGFWQARIYSPELFPGQGFAYTMIRKLDGLTTLLLATIFAAFLLFSCAAKQSPREITVTVPADYSGELNLSPCSRSAPAEVSVDSKGFGPTSACPKADEAVTLTIIRGGADLRVPPDQVTIERAGDGLPVAIKARVPAQ